MINDAASRKRWFSYWAILPMLLLLLAELWAFVFWLPNKSGITLFAVIISSVLLITGFVPALVRPSRVTNLIGCFTIALAGNAFLPSHMLYGISSFDQVINILLTSENIIWLLNVVILAPLTLHLAAIFPQRSSISMHSIVSYYIIVISIPVIALFLPTTVHLFVMILLILIVYAGFGGAAYLFLRMIRNTHPINPHTVQQARLLLLSLIIAQLPITLMPISELLGLRFSYQFVFGVQIILPIGIAYTILRHDLFGIDAALRRAIQYATVSFGLLALYFCLTSILAQIVRQSTGAWSFLATITSVIAAAAAFTPLSRVVQRVVDRAFYPERLAFLETISKVRAALSRVVQRQTLLTLFEEELPKQLGASWGKLALQPSFEQPSLALQQGSWSMPLIVGGQTLGCYWLGARSSGLPYAENEQDQLRSLVQQAALALAYADTFSTLAQLNHELEERVTERTKHVLAQQRELATFEERQRIARDLHDSIKQTLFSLGLGIRSARSIVRGNPEAAITLLQQQEQAAVQAQIEMGDLLAQLRTPATESADLVPTLEHICAALQQQHGLRVAQDLPTALVLPESLTRELANVVKEGLHNILRHSGVTQAELYLAANIPHRGCLALTIVDHGRGFDPAITQHGHGLRGMQERITALGGNLIVQSVPNKGTTIWAELNLAERKTPQPDLSV
jgi:signal transduction histidine kinase